VTSLGVATAGPTDAATAEATASSTVAPEASSAAPASSAPSAPSAAPVTSAPPPTTTASVAPSASAAPAPAVTANPAVVSGPHPPIRVANGKSGLTLRVGGQDFMVRGMNWDYVPIGKNYSYSLWSQPDAVIKEALDREMPLLQRMGVNAIRQYVGVPARWVKYTYETYGIFTVLNHTVGRYGYNLGGVWHPSVDYSDPALRAALEADVVALVDEYKDVPGVLMWLLGNENNYGLSWASSEIEALPEGERDAARARKLYSLFGKIIASVKQHDQEHPVAIANGDLQYIDVIAQECKGLDVFGANVYRGKSARDLYQVVKDKLGLPVMFTEFGADAYDAKRMREDDLTQARYLLAQWQEIYEQSAGKGGVGNAIGGMVFQWSDGWWKYKQDQNLDVHDTNASWPNAAYAEDFVAGENNMNEEWWGICAKGPADSRGIFEETPRTAYYVLQKVFQIAAYDPELSVSAIREAFGKIDPDALAVRYRADAGLLAFADLDRVRVTGIRSSFETYSTGGTRRVRTDVPGNGDGFGHTESFYVDVQAKPTASVVATISVNVLGNVASNPIDETTYERRGGPKLVADASDPTGKTTFTLPAVERVKVYRSTVSWDEPWFHLDGYYRVGHYHWGNEGDFFGLYREAFYGPAIDTYNAEVPIGVELSGKKSLDGLKIAFGPQIWWGANPQVMAKYRHAFGPVTGTVMYAEEFQNTNPVATSSAAPVPPTRKATVTLAGAVGPVRFEVGGIWAGSTLVDRPFYNAVATGAGWSVRNDKIRGTDTLGAKAKVVVEGGRVHWYASGAYMGLVANGGPTSTITFAGWSLKDSGSGNQVNATTGLAVDVGPLQIGPNFLWQKPLIGPIPGGLPDATPRNVLDDPFVVRANRETVGAELLIVYDPTPATWMWAWDNDLREDAPFAASLDLAYRHLPTTQDSGLGVLANGSLFAFNGAPSAHDLWEGNLRMVANLAPELRLVARAYDGIAQSSGISDRLIRRYGADARIIWKSTSLAFFAKFNDWGPYDYHRDFNLTFPVQLMSDLSYVLGTPRWMNLWQTRLGIRGTMRFLNGYSPRFCPNPAAVTGDGSCDPLSGPSAWGKEWEIRTYLNVNL
jgi:hypothetical protein